MFTDEKIFTRNGYFNRKNDVVWANNRNDANEYGGIHEREKYPVSIIVALGATWNGITVPFFFQMGERLNGKTYLDELLPFYKMEGDRLFGHQNWRFQQDGASCHTDKGPTKSPELNPLDYSIWNSIFNNVDYYKVKTINDLRREIEKATKKIDVNCVWDTISVFRRRVQSVEKHNGELIIDEHC
ncbi:unnamed protein product [Rotaria magnacalcarata]|uniref:Transposase n=1 Tax=Rotaria magnacalcarata TaxID=392030 RepID=A0A820GBX5_9BILA|nr:unnamed protein product [Rotaria magnacalcarata]